eukprot:CCRYP_011507-RB/>CCRYP_011507-RB protein AED:0.01 eAED:0.01 QI:94/-1/1/1/-1/1/1/75/501
MASSIKHWIVAIALVLTFITGNLNIGLITSYDAYNAYHFHDGVYQVNNLGKNPFDSLSTPKPLPTLVLTDPHFLGGFRNQHMRFVAFVDHAIKQNISQILLPSLRWGDAYNRGKSIPHEYLFDVKYWNARAKEKGLPFLVRYDVEVLEGSTQSQPCFNSTSGLYHGLDEEFLRHNETNLRKIDTLAEIRKSGLIHCRGGPSSEAIGNSSNPFPVTNLVPIGAGKGAGKFWNDYYKLQGRRSKTIIDDRIPVEQAIFQLLRPSEEIRWAVDKAINAAATNRTREMKSNKCRLLALHPRVEQEMLTHRCSKHQENNLTKVLERIWEFPPFSVAMDRDGHNTTANKLASAKFGFDLLFLAVSAYQVEKPPRDDPLAIPLHAIMVENHKTLLNARAHGFHGSVPVFESGAGTAKEVRFWKVNSDNMTSFSAESLGVVELVASIVNFFTSVNADVFVGVRGSSFSTDVFAVRHYLNKDVGNLHGRNYIISPDGIEELIGPPRVHNC